MITWQKQNTQKGKTDTLQQKSGMEHTGTKRNKVRKTDTLFLDYARMRKNVYKSQRKDNTRAMYSNAELQVRPIYL